MHFAGKTVPKPLPRSCCRIEGGTVYTYLMMTSGPKVGVSVLLRETFEPIRIGRQGDCQLQLEDPLCSRHHAEIWFQDGHWYLRDLSRNGTFVNGLRITEQVLSDG